MYILGLDVSTRCIGYCLLNNKGNVEKLDYIWLENLNYSEKIDLIKNTFLSFSSQNCKIYIEEALRRSNNQNVVNILQRWNGMVCALLYEWLGIYPITITEVNARKLNNIKIPKNVVKKEKKKFVLEYLINIGLFPKEKIVLKKTNNYKDFCYDMSDAIVIARAAYIKEKNAQKSS